MTEEDKLLEEKIEEFLESKPEERKENNEKVELGKQLLLQDGKKEEGIQLLIEASKAGDKEATEALKQCLQTGDGITEGNEDEVEWCVNTPGSEKHLKHAISELFNSLKRQGHDKVSVGEIGKAIKKAKEKLTETVESGASSVTAAISANERDEQLGLMSLLTNVVSVGGRDEVTMGEFMETAMSYAKGDVPELVTVLNEEDMEKYNEANLVGKVLRYPHQSAESLKHYILSNISKRGSAMVKSLIPTAQIQTLLLLYLYHQLTAEMFMFIIPLVVFYISMAALVVFSLQMFYGREALKQLKSVSELMKRFDPMVDEKEAEATFMWKSIRPYISFFISLVIAVAVFPVCDKTWIPCSELSLVALFFTVSAFRGLPSDYDEYAMYTIGLKVLTTVLQSLKGVRGVWLLSHPLMAVPLPYGLEFHISLPSILHVIILSMLVVMAGRNSWRGIYKVLIPHLVCLLWWQMFTVLFDCTTWRSLGRASLGWLILITMLPLLLVYIIGIFLVNFMQWFLTLALAMKLAVTAIAIAVSSVIVLYSNLRLPKDVTKRRRVVLAVVAAVVVFLLGPLIYANYVPARKGTSGGLTWERYQDLCGTHSLSDKARFPVEAVLQAQCSEFIGETVRATGTVSYVKVDKVENKFRSFVMAMPNVIQPSLRCLLGSAKRHPFGDCSLASFDRYTFAMGVEMITTPAGEGTSPYTTTLKVKLMHGFYATMMKMTPGTKVTVKGRLEGGLGTSAVAFSLRSLYVDGARVKPLGGVQREDVSASLRQAARYSVGFFLSPLVNQQAGIDDEDEEED